MIFCWCGRPENSDRCLKEKHLEGKKIKIRQVRFSGDSKYRQEQGQFQAKEGR